MNYGLDRRYIALVCVFYKIAKYANIYCKCTLDDTFTWILFLVYFAVEYEMPVYDKTELWYVIQCNVYKVKRVFAKDFN